MDENLDGPLTVADVAKLLRRSTEQVRRYLREGVLPGRRVGGQWFVARRDADDFLARQGGQSNPAPLVSFVDASALVALADRDDASHAAAVAAHDDLVTSGFRLFTTDLALAAAHELLLATLGPEAARSWLAHCNIHVHFVTAEDLEHGRRAIEEGSSDPAATLADTVHLAVLDRLGVTDVFAVDRAFLGMLG